MNRPRLPPFRHDPIHSLVYLGFDVKCKIETVKAKCDRQFKAITEMKLEISNKRQYHGDIITIDESQVRS